MNAAQKTAVKQLYNEIESFTGLTFTEITETTTVHATMRFGMTTNNTNTASGYYPGTSDEAGDSWYRNGGSYDAPTLGSYAYNEGFMHEIGHTLGLLHGHDGANNPLGGLPSDKDSNEFSVMTYRDHVGDALDFSENETWGNPQSYMMFDIAALQYMYGADYSASGNVWSGNSIYTFSATTGEMSINGVGQGAPGGNRIFRTIWDGHGEDTYDLSNYTKDLKINLNPGEWSIFDNDQLADLDGGDRAINLARGNVANSLLHNNDARSLIENAIGGSGNDEITGNAGDNKLTGGGGNDKINGNAGDDYVIAGDGLDTVDGGDGSDWLYGQGGDDTINAGAGAMDVSLGDDGNDTINGEAGMDYMYGYAGNDWLFGEAGNDKLFGGAGIDILMGGVGTDEITGGKGNDWMWGGDMTGAGDVAVAESSITGADFIFA